MTHIELFRDTLGPVARNVLPGVRFIRTSMGSASTARWKQPNVGVSSSSTHSRSMLKPRGRASHRLSAQADVSSKDHPVAVAYRGDNTLTGNPCPLYWVAISGGTPRAAVHFCLPDSQGVGGGRQHPLLALPVQHGAPQDRERQQHGVQKTA